MSWPGHGTGGRRGYHHGNLREALIEAALDLIAKKGPAGFTFADAARSVGVSAAAPYRHFRDRDALLADVARRGFELFATHLDHAWNDGRPDPFTAFENVGRAYLAFARDEPAYYSAMFEAGLSLEGDPGLRDIAERSFAVLLKASKALCGGLPAEKRPPSLMMSLHAWALSHGIASLFARGDGGRRRLPMTPEELLEAGVLIYLRGLGVLAPPADPEP
ncbi:MAG: TetR/AcrR family transcriptional regulator [Alphaproteobacteria bacterium]|nr:TetR/AcrR family transcriptional regulator [Alphaproteobacteria bacterium]